VAFSILMAGCQTDAVWIFWTQYLVLQANRILQARGKTAFLLPNNNISFTVRMNEQQTLASGASPSISRRRFFGYAGALAGVALIAGNVGCKKEEDPLAGTIDLGSGEMGALNLAFAMEQVEAAFYSQIVLTPYTSMSSSELAYLTNIRDHELAHREFFRKLLGTNAIKDLKLDFSGIDFTKRTSVLDTAKTMEDLGVSAYNGMAKLLTTDAYLEVIAKIASVEARHAAHIRNLGVQGTFADANLIDSSGQDLVRDPKDVVPLLHMFIQDRLNPNNLPTS
jgi:rubrerythrin